MPGEMNDPHRLGYPWPVSGGGRAIGPWSLGDRYWSNSWTSNPSMVPLTSVLRSEMSTLQKSMF